MKDGVKAIFQFYTTNFTKHAAIGLGIGYFGGMTYATYMNATSTEIRNLFAPCAGLRSVGGYGTCYGISGFVFGLTWPVMIPMSIIFGPKQVICGMATMVADNELKLRKWQNKKN
jgi:uncharacterized membrane protein